MSYFSSVVIMFISMFGIEKYVIFNDVFDFQSESVLLPIFDIGQGLDYTPTCIFTFTYLCRKTITKNVIFLTC